MAELLAEYECAPERYGPPAPPSAARDLAIAGHHEPPDVEYAATVAQPVKIDNDLYVRDYGKCVLCYKCVEACGTDHQNTFAIAVAGRGFDARISTEFAVPLPDSACVYCGNCIAVCPTGALMASREHELRSAASGTKRGRRRPTPSVRTAASAARCAARAGRRDRQGDLAARQRHHAGQSLHQGPLRLAVRAASAESMSGD